MNPLLWLYGKPIDILTNHYHKYLKTKIRQTASMDKTAEIPWDAIIDDHVSIGEKTSIGYNAVIKGSKTTWVRIGDYCFIGHNFHAYSATHDINNPVPSKDKDFGRKESDVVIGDSCWIGDNVFVDSGVHIGNNCIIGAGAVVIMDIPPFSVVGGVPAKLIRAR
jgi:maltose O-acetyltransferase